MNKPDVAKKIMSLLGITIDDSDFSEKKESGGGGTVTRHALDKILAKIEELGE